MMLLPITNKDQQVVTVSRVTRKRFLSRLLCNHNNQTHFNIMSTRIDGNAITGLVCRDCGKIISHREWLPIKGIA